MKNTRQRVQHLALALLALVLLSCVCFVGCGQNLTAPGIPSNPPSDTTPQAEDSSLAEPNLSSEDSADPIESSEKSNHQNTVDILIEKIVNMSGGVINIYYNASNEAGETWSGVIRFDPNGGEAPDDAAMTLDQDKQYFNLACPFTRPGYLFRGWSLDTSGDPYIYPTNDHFSAYPIAEIVNLAKANDKDGDLTFYALWGQNCVITYDANKPAGATHEVTGMPGQNPVSWRYDENIVLAPEPSLEDFRFDGWYRDAAGQNKVGNGNEVLTNQNLAVAGNIRLYAKWVEDTYRVIYDANKPANATGSVTELPSQNPVTWKCNQDITLAAAPSLVGWTFEGWYSEALCQTKIGSESGVLKKPDFAAGTTVHLYAKWTENSYKVTYNENKPENASGNVNAMPAKNPAVWTYDQNATLAAAPTLTGFDFVAWFKDPDQKIKVGDAKEVLTKPNLVTDGTVLLYAGWKPQSYTVSFNATANGGTCSTESKLVVSGKTYGELPEATKEGSKFLGWFTQQSGGEKVESTTLVQAGQDHTLYARFDTERYSLSYHLNKPQNAQAYNKSLPNGVTFDSQALIATQNCIKSQNTNLCGNIYSVLGWNLLGWATTPDGIVKYTAKDLTDTVGLNDHVADLYAVWELDPWTVGQNVSNGSKVKSTFDGIEYTVYNTYNDPDGFYTCKNAIVDFSNRAFSNRCFFYVIGDETYFIGNPGYEFEGTICLAGTEGQTSKIYMQNLRIKQDYSYVVYATDGFKSGDVELDIRGVCSIISNKASTQGEEDAAVLLPNHNVKVTGPGTLTVKGGDGITEKNGAIAILACNLTVDMTGSLVATGGNGGNGTAGKRGSDGSSEGGGTPGSTGGDGGNGGKGASAIKCAVLTVSEPSTLILTAGNGGNGGNGGAGGNGGRDNYPFSDGNNVGGQGGNGGRGGACGKALDCTLSNAAGKVICHEGTVGAGGIGGNGGNGGLCTGGAAGGAGGSGGLNGDGTVRAANGSDGKHS